MKKSIFIMLTVALFAACKGNVSESEKDAARMYIGDAIEVTNNILGGEQIDFMTYCDMVEFRNDNVYYNYTVDEDYTTMDNIRNNINVVKEQLEQHFDNNQDAKELSDMLAKLNGKYVFRYTGNKSGEQVSFEIKP